MTSFRHVIRLAAVVALVASAQAAQAQWHAPKLDRALQQAPAGSRQAVIIRYRPGADATVTAQVQRHGNQIRSRFATIGAASADVTADDLQTLAANPDVESISLDAPVHATATPATSTTLATAPSLRATLGLTPSATGVGIGVAVIDSGIAPLRQFGRRLRAFYDFTSGAAVATLPVDPYEIGRAHV